VTTVFVDGNNVMGSRPDGSWRNRAEAAQRLVDKIAPVARRHAGAWAIVFAGPGPTEVAAPLECHSVLHNGHGRRDGADDRIVELVGALPDRATTLVYTSAAALRARVHALGARVAGARALLEEIAAAYSSAGPVRTQHLGSLDWQFQSIHRMLAGRTGCRGRFTRDRARRLERVRCLFPRGHRAPPRGAARRHLERARAGGGRGRCPHRARDAEHPPPAPRHRERDRHQPHQERGTIDEDLCWQNDRARIPY